MRWQLQEAKQRFSELVRRAQNDGPQLVSKHGKDVAVVLAVDDYRRLQGTEPDFRDFLLAAPDLGALDISRATDPAPTVELDSRELPR
jgi:prevent-host-death family protein